SAPRVGSPAGRCPPRAGPWPAQFTGSHAAAASGAALPGNTAWLRGRNPRTGCSERGTHLDPDRKHPEKQRDRRQRSSFLNDGTEHGSSPLERKRNIVLFLFPGVNKKIEAPSQTQWLAASEKERARRTLPFAGPKSSLPLKKSAARVAELPRHVAERVL